MSSATPRKGWEEILIYQVQQRRFLWDPQDDNYKNPWQRRNGWQEIGTTLNLIPDQCSSKWKSLRTKFGKLRSKIRNARSGAGEDEVEDPDWEYWKTLDFLHSTLDAGESSGNLDELFEVVEERLTEEEEKIEESETEGRGEEKCQELSSEESDEEEDKAIVDKTTNRANKNLEMKKKEQEKVKKQTTKGQTKQIATKKNVGNPKTKSNTQINANSNKSSLPNTMPNVEISSNVSHREFFKTLEPFTDQIPVRRVLDFRNDVNNKVKEYICADDENKKKSKSKSLPQQRKNKLEELRTEPMQDGEDPIELDNDDSDVEFLGEYQLSKSEAKRRRNIEFSLGKVKIEPTIKKEKLSEEICLTSQPPPIANSNSFTSFNREILSSQNLNFGAQRNLAIMNHIVHLAHQHQYILRLLEQNLNCESFLTVSNDLLNPQKSRQDNLETLPSFLNYDEVN